MNLVYSWFMERVSFVREDQERQKIIDWLWSPPTGKDPDKVAEDVVEEEMSLFYQAARQNT